MDMNGLKVASKQTLEKLGSFANETVSSEVSSFAKRQLMKFGWTE
jgi:hypothetical protein